MSTYYYRDGHLYTTKTMCNLVQFWQHEVRVYPDERHIRFTTLCDRAEEAAVALRKLNPPWSS